MKRILVKTVTSFTALTFIFPSLIWAFEPDVYSFSQANIRHVQYQGKSIIVPAQLGSIEKSVQGRNKTIIHIQDLHCNYEVQKNIAGIIHLLAQEHNLKVVGEEGAFSSVNTDLIRRFPFAQVRLAVSDFFLHQGRLTGAEYYASTGEHRVRLEGIETPLLYEEGLRALRSFLNAESLGYCLDLRDRLESLKPSLYSVPLLTMDQGRKAFRSGHWDVRAYAAQLKNLADQYHLPIDKYQVLASYLNQGAREIRTPLEPDALLAEMDALDLELRKGVFTSSPQRELDAHIHRLEIIEKLLNISVTSRDLEEFKQNREGFSVQAFAAFIRQQAVALAHTEPGTTVDAEIYRLNHYLDQVAAFYELANGRSQHFVDNLIRKMDAAHEELAVMITGGFHTDEVLAECEKRGISYLSIKPRVTQWDVPNPYFDLLQNKPLPLEKLLAKNQLHFAIRSSLETQGFLPVLGLTLGAAWRAVTGPMPPQDLQPIEKYLEGNFGVRLGQPLNQADIESVMGSAVSLPIHSQVYLVHAGSADLPVLIAPRHYFHRALRTQIKLRQGDYLTCQDRGIAIFPAHDWRGLQMVAQAAARYQRGIDLAPYLPHESPLEILRDWQGFLAQHKGNRLILGVGLVSIFGLLPALACAAAFLAASLSSWGSLTAWTIALGVLTINFLRPNLHWFLGQVQTYYIDSVIHLHALWNRWFPQVQLQIPPNGERPVIPGQDPNSTSQAVQQFLGQGAYNLFLLNSLQDRQDKALEHRMLSEAERLHPPLSAILETMIQVFFKARQGQEPGRLAELEHAFNMVLKPFKLAATFFFPRDPRYPLGFGYYIHAIRFRRVFHVRERSSGFSLTKECLFLSQVSNAPLLNLAGRSAPTWDAEAVYLENLQNESEQILRFAMQPRLSFSEWKFGLKKELDLAAVFSFAGRFSHQLTAQEKAAWRALQLEIEVLTTGLRDFYTQYPDFPLQIRTPPLSVHAQAKIRDAAAGLSPEQAGRFHKLSTHYLEPFFQAISGYREPCWESLKRVIEEMDEALGEPLRLSMRQDLIGLLGTEAVANAERYFSGELASLLADLRVRLQQAGLVFEPDLSKPLLPEQITVMADLNGYLPQPIEQFAERLRHASLMHRAATAAYRQAVIRLTQALGISIGGHEFWHGYNRERITRANAPWNPVLDEAAAVAAHVAYFSALPRTELIQQLLRTLLTVEGTAEQASQVQARYFLTRQDQQPHFDQQASDTPLMPNTLRRLLDPLLVDSVSARQACQAFLTSDTLPVPLRSRARDLEIWVSDPDKVQGGQGISWFWFMAHNWVRTHIFKLFHPRTGPLTWEEFRQRAQWIENHYLWLIITGGILIGSGFLAGDVGYWDTVRQAFTGTSPAPWAKWISLTAWLTFFVGAHLNQGTLQTRAEWKANLRAAGKIFGMVVLAHAASLWAAVLLSYLAHAWMNDDRKSALRLTYAFNLAEGGLADLVSTGTLVSDLYRSPIWLEKINQEMRAYFDLDKTAVAARGIFGTSQKLHIIVEKKSLLNFFAGWIMGRYQHGDPVVHLPQRLMDDYIRGRGLRQRLAGSLIQWMILTSGRMRLPQTRWKKIMTAPMAKAHLLLGPAQRLIRQVVTDQATSVPASELLRQSYTTLLAPYEHTGYDGMAATDPEGLPEALQALAAMRSPGVPTLHVRTPMGVRYRLPMPSDPEARKAVWAQLRRCRIRIDRFQSNPVPRRSPRLLTSA